ncbi:hypothetical protein LCGC14_2845200, partial [marine sediment metagenome]
MKGANQPLISPGDLGFNPLVNIIGTPLLAPANLGGITQGITEITYHLLDAETIINQPVKVTQQMINTGIYIVNDGYPLSVFGIVKEFEKEIIVDGEVIGTEKVGLDFTEEQLDVIGKFSNGAWQGSVRKRISGATDSNGLFGAIGIPEIKFEDVAQPEQEQLFIKIVRDDRKLKFRGDNPDATGDKAYPFKITGNWAVDATDKQIRIKTIDENNRPILKSGDIIYLTYSIAYERHLRQTLTHLGKIGQTSSIGIVGFTAAIESKADIFDYQISSWKVPVLPDNITLSNIDELETKYAIDDDYKLSFLKYKDIRIKERDIEDYNPVEENDCDIIEGWR